MIGLSGDVVMSTTGALTSAAIYLSPFKTYGQLVPSHSGTQVTGHLEPVGGRAQCPGWPQYLLVNPMLSPYVIDQPQIMSSRSLIHVPCIYHQYQQPAESSLTSVVSNQGLTHSHGGIPSTIQLHTLTRSLNPSDPLIHQSADNPLVASTNMEVVWHSQFDRLFNTFPHHWQLQPVAATDDKLVNAGEYTVFQDSAKVRFLCKYASCSNAWTSMKGRVIFWIKPPQPHHHHHHHHHHGIVRFKLFGQKCQKCKPDTFTHAMWYPQEAIKVVYNLYTRVGELFYGFPSSNYCTQRRTGKPRQPHKSELCQACANNICRVASKRTAVSHSSSTATSPTTESTDSFRDT